VVADGGSPFARAIGELLPSVFPVSEAPGQPAKAASHRRFRLRGRR
jgi:hypothetical protein